MSNIVLWYDTVDNGIIRNNFQHGVYKFSNTPSTLPTLFIKNNIDFVCNITAFGAEYFFKKHKDSINFYPIELGHHNTREDTKNFPIDKYWFFKKINADIEILFWYPNEGFKFNRKDDSFFELLGSIHEFSPNNKIRFIFGDFYRPEYLPDYVNYKCFKNFFWYKTSISISRPTLSIDKESRYDFITLNRRHRMSRYMVLQDLKNREMLKNAYCTNMMVTLHNPKDLFDQFKTYYSIKEDEEFCMKFQNDTFSEVDVRTSNASSPVIDITLSDINLNNVSYLELVNETFFDSTSTLFITEKTYRAIALGHIFLICGQRGTLKHLKQAGFQTFDDLFDESYDDIISFSQRWAIIKKNLELWISMPESAKREYYIKSFDKLVYNQNLLYSKNFEKEIKGLFE